MIARFNGRTTATCAAMAVLVFAGVAIAQQAQPQPGQQPGQPQLQQRQQQAPIQQRVARPVTQANLADSQLAACLLIDNHNEVALARLAQQRAQSDDVKQFARQMVEDHTKLVDRLQPFAGNYAQLATGQQAQSPRQTTGGGLDIVDFKRRIGQKCLDSIRSELDKKDGRKFDQCYTGQQVMAHMMMRDVLEVSRDFASAELRPVLEEGLRTTEAHLKQAQDLAEEQMDHRQTEQARRDGESRK